MCENYRREDRRLAMIPPASKIPFRPLFLRPGFWARGRRRLPLLHFLLLLHVSLLELLSLLLVTLLRRLPFGVRSVLFRQLLMFFFLLLL